MEQGVLHCKMDMILIIYGDSQRVTWSVLIPTLLSPAKRAVPCTFSSTHLRP